MRKLTELPSEADAGHLVDRLLVAGIDSEIRTRAPWEVWVLDDDDLPRAAQLIADFKPGERAPDVVRAAAELRKERERRQSRAGRRMVVVADRWRGGSVDTLGPVTLFLVVGSVLVALYSDFGDPATMTIQNLSIEPWDSYEFLGKVQDGEVWRLVTPMFIHFGPLHLLFNCMWAWQLGRQIEHNHGPLTMIGLVLLSEIPGGLGQYLVTGPNFGGMSGVVYGLFGFVWMQARYAPARGYQIDDRTTAMIMVWFVACATGLLGPIANIGHAGGLVAGLLAGLPAYVGHLRDRIEEPEFAAGNWASINVRGGRRLARQFFTPYVPLWFLLLAVVVIALDL
ncbi:rhomboid family intramembrane serine protease [Nannocystis punicea]|uniref:Rhomboid family intramembrane serine protease n=1 Tax=Nannocystis punicea TaxID=2995304 RepID=A0ABY7GXX6_9BACT|nr:rhomboid family intramembrane serine protease [Nannocystis poenicansa]WAS91750.1 rhomboid family intramembrane serine protease [Nannocystis poenicansa]